MFKILIRKILFIDRYFYEHVLRLAGFKIIIKKFSACSKICSQKSNIFIGSGNFSFRTTENYNHFLVTTSKPLKISVNSVVARSRVLIGPKIFISN